MEIKWTNDFKEFLELLNSKKVEYIVVGGYSLAAFGYVRATGDLDIWVSNNSKNIEKLHDVFTQFGIAIDTETVKKLEGLNKRIVLGRPPVQLDIMTSIDGVVFDVAIKNSSIKKIDGVSVNIISYKDLLANKRSTGRLKDLADVEELEKLNSKRKRS